MTHTSADGHMTLVEQSYTCFLEGTELKENKRKEKFRRKNSPKKLPVKDLAGVFTEFSSFSDSLEEWTPQPAAFHQYKQCSQPILVYKKIYRWKKKEIKEMIEKKGTPSRWALGALQEGSGSLCCHRRWKLHIICTVALGDSPMGQSVDITMMICGDILCTLNVVIYCVP